MTNGIKLSKSLLTEFNNEAKKQYGISDEDSRAIGAALFPGRKPGDLTEQEVNRFIDEFKPITQAGIKTLMGAVASIGMGDDQVKELISAWWGYTSKKQIKVYQLRQIVAWVESQRADAPLAPRKAPMTVAGVAIE